MSAPWPILRWAALVLLISGCTELAPDIAIQAGSRRVTLEELRVIYADLDPPFRPPLATAEQRLAFARRVLERMLLAEEGKRLLAADTAAVGFAAHREREAVLIRRLRILETGAAVVDSSDALAAFERMRVHRRIQTVEFADESHAQAAHARLTLGEPFEALQTQEIADVPERERWVAWTPQVDPIADALADAEPGSVVGPIRTRNAWVLMRVMERAAHEPGTFEDLRIQIHQGLKARREIEAMERLVDRLRAETGFRLEEAAVEQVVARITDAILEAGATEGDPDWALPRPAAGDDSLQLAAWRGGSLTVMEYVAALRGDTRSQRPRASLPLEVRRVIGQTANTRLLVAEAERRGLARDWWVARALGRLAEERAVQRGIASIDRGDEAPIADADSIVQLLETAWPDLFRTPPAARVLRLETQSRSAGVAERARVLRAGGPEGRLREILAGVAVPGGAYHLLLSTRSEMPPDAADEIFSSGPGTVTGPHPSGDAWVVLGCLELKEAGTRSQADVLKDLHARQGQSGEAGRVAEWIAQRERELGVSIDERVLDALTPGG